jgi:hypothetical protein
VREKRGVKEREREREDKLTDNVNPVNSSCGRTEDEDSRIGICRVRTEESSIIRYGRLKFG